MIVEFASKEHRDYYVNDEPAHKAFVASLEGVVEKAQVLDFEDRVY